MSRLADARRILRHFVDVVEIRQAEYCRSHHGAVRRVDVAARHPHAFGDVVGILHKNFIVETLKVERERERERRSIRISK